MGNKGKAHHEADKTVRKHDSNIKSDRQSGKKPTDPDLQARGNAITTRADLKAAINQEK